MADNNNNKILNVPPLRFPEFTDEWEKQKLSDFVERVTRKNKNNESKLPLTISAQYGLVDQITFFNKVIASNDISGYYLLKKGEFAYNKSYSGDYTWGAVKRLDRYEQGALSTLYICFSPLECVISDYLVHYFETKKWHREVSEIAVEGARNHGLLNIGVADYFNTKHFLPSKKEQKKIAAFLNLIEKRIALQTKIIEKYKSLIKGIRDVLLVDNCSRPIPLSEILIEFTEKTTMNNQYEVLSSTVSGIYSQKEIFNKEVASPNNIGYKILHYDDVVLSPQNLWMGNINYNDKYKIGIVSPSYKTYRIAEDYDKKFIAAILKTHRALYNYMLVSEQGASVVRRNLNIEAFEQLIFKIPNYEKQQKIGSILRNLEYKLSRLERLKNCYLRQKQFFLQQMFI